MQISAVFARACDLAIGLGHVGINKLPGCLEIQVDEHWWFAINAHAEKVESSKGNVPEGCIYFTFNEWPAGIINAQGGTLCASAVGNEGELLKALDAAILRQMPEAI